MGDSGIDGGVRLGLGRLNARKGGDLAGLRVGIGGVLASALAIVRSRTSR